LLLTEKLLPGKETDVDHAILLLVPCHGSPLLSVTANNLMSLVLHFHLHRAAVGLKSWKTKKLLDLNGVMGEIPNFRIGSVNG
jgi:hypothetical protein